MQGYMGVSTKGQCHGGMPGQRLGHRRACPASHDKRNEGMPERVEVDYSAVRTSVGQVSRIQPFARVLRHPETIAATSCAHRRDRGAALPQPARPRFPPTAVDRPTCRPGSRAGLRPRPAAVVASLPCGSWHRPPGRGPRAMGRPSRRISGAKLANSEARKPVPTAARYRWNRSGPESPRNVRRLARVDSSRQLNSAGEKSRRARRTSVSAYARLDMPASGSAAIRRSRHSQRVKLRAAAK